MNRPFAYVEQPEPEAKDPYLYKVGQIEVKIDKGGSIRFTDALARGLLNSNSKEE